VAVHLADVLVIPTRLVERFEQLRSEEVRDLFLLAQRVQKIVECIHEAKASTMTIQDGTDAGQTIKVSIK
jgi:diadenosine tetraphosphate (Ap4A) HIT family hydrolase